MKEVLERFGFGGERGFASAASAALVTVQDMAILAHAVAVQLVLFPPESLKKFLDAKVAMLRGAGSPDPHEQAHDRLVEAYESTLLLLIMSAIARGIDPIEGLAFAEKTESGWTFVTPAEGAAEEDGEVDERTAEAIKQFKEASVNAETRAGAPSVHIDWDALDADEFGAPMHFTSIGTIGPGLGALLHRRHHIHTAEAALRFFASEQWKSDVAMMNEVDVNRRDAIIAELVMWLGPLEEEDAAVDGYDMIEQVAELYGKSVEDMAGDWGRDGENMAKVAGALSVMLCEDGYFERRPNALAALRHELKRSELATAAAQCCGYARITLRRKRHTDAIMEIVATPEDPKP